MHTPTKPSGLSYDAISQVAERIGRRFNIYDEDGCANIDALISKVGGRVEVADQTESLHVNERGNFTIYIPYSTSPRRDRFTMAHELGHYFLHYVLPKETGMQSYGRGARNRAETEANVFAAALLMPAEEFRRMHSRARDSWALAGIFQVSPAAAEVRAQALRIS